MIHEKQNHRLITKENAVYELDTDCLCRRFQKCDASDVPLSEEERLFSQELPRYSRESLAQMKLFAHKTLRLSGRGIGVAVLDTGAMRHPDFSDRIVSFYDCLHERKECYDDHGHGTHVAGIIAGNGRRSDGRIKGMAPAASLYVVKVLDERGEGKSENLMKGCQYLLELYEKQKSDGWPHLRIVNISIGSMMDPSKKEYSKMLGMMEALWDAGLIVCVAAGNQGHRLGSVTAPGICRKVITVGTSDDSYPIPAGKNHVLKNYSGRGPTSTCIMKPEIIAPGYRILSTGRDGYSVRSGTSMSTPVVAGALALLLQQYPMLTNREVKLLLRQSARNLKMPIEKQGWGELDLRRLLEVAKQYRT